MAEQPRDSDAQLRRTAELERTVIGAAPVTGGSTMAAAGAFTAQGGDDLGGPGQRDPGDGAGRLSPETSAELIRGAPTRAEEVFGSDEDTSDDQISDALRHGSEPDR